MNGFAGSLVRADPSGSGYSRFEALHIRFDFRHADQAGVEKVIDDVDHFGPGSLGFSGQGLAGLIRQRYGARAGVLSITALVLANVGTTTAEFAGIAAGCQIFGISPYASVPLAALLVSTLVLRGGFRGIERVLLLLSAVFVAYIAAGFLAGPDWGAAARGLVVPTLPQSRDIEAVCLLGEVPYYLQGAPWPYPKASISVLEVLGAEPEVREAGWP